MKDAIVRDLERALLSAIKERLEVGKASPIWVRIERSTGRIYSNTSLSLEEIGAIATRVFKQVLIDRFRQVERDAGRYRDRPT